MHRAIFLVCLSLLATGCGRERKLELGPFAEYVHAFERTSADVGRGIVIDDLIVEFGAMERPSEQGYCLQKSEETPVVRINAATWERMNETERHLLIYHELGHCILGRRHTADIMPPDLPRSLMNPYALDAETYEENQSHYNNELFNG